MTYRAEFGRPGLALSATGEWRLCLRQFGTSAMDAIEDGL